eukprot:1137186-Pelagomonas_calceolata.AAC.5
MGCVWYSRSTLESWFSLRLLPSACEIWVGSRGKACVRSVGRTWVGVVPCASVGGPSMRELCTFYVSPLMRIVCFCMCLIVRRLVILAVEERTF